MPIKGNAQFTYDPGSGVVTVPLNWPLEAVATGTEGLRSGSRQRVWINESLDLTRREGFSVGSPVRRISGDLRFIDNQDAVLTMLAEGAANTVLTYSPDGGTTTFPSRLISPGPDEVQELREDVASSKGDNEEYRISITLEHDTGGNYNSLLQ